MAPHGVCCAFGGPGGVDGWLHEALVWHKAVELRKKLCGVGILKSGMKKDTQAFFERTPAYTFAGRPGESHRVFLFSADLVRECRNASWATPCECDKTARPLLEFMLSQVGPADICVWFEGRSKSWRKEIDKATENARRLAELWLIFRPPPRLGRKISFAPEVPVVAHEAPLQGAEGVRLRWRAVHARHDIHRRGADAMEGDAQGQRQGQGQHPRLRARIAAAEALRHVERNAALLAGAEAHQLLGRAAEGHRRRVRFRPHAGFGDMRPRRDGHGHFVHL